VFPLRYGLNAYILFIRNSFFKELKVYAVMLANVCTALAMILAFIRPCTLAGSVFPHITVWWMVSSWLSRQWTLCSLQVAAVVSAVSAGGWPTSTQLTTRHLRSIHIFFTTPHMRLHSPSLKETGLYFDNSLGLHTYLHNRLPGWPFRRICCCIVKDTTVSIALLRV
jgi:hypothetical protein